MKFGQIGGPGNLAGDARSRIGIRLWAGRGRDQNPVMPTTFTLLPLTATAMPVRFQQQSGRHRRPTLPAS